MTFETENKTMYEIIFQQRNLFLDVFMIALSVVFLGILANVRIPLWPVPITLQTFGVFTIAFFFGSRKGMFALLAYTLAGLVGFGVFAGYNSGSSVFYTIKEGAIALGPTAGYIIGFIFASFVVGWLIEKGYGRDWKSILWVLLVGEIIIYTFGIPWLWLALPQLSLWQLLMAGLIPFLVGDFLKMVAAAGVFPYLWKGAEKISQ